MVERELLRGNRQTHPAVAQSGPADQLQASSRTSGVQDHLWRDVCNAAPADIVGSISGSEQGVREENQLIGGVEPLDVERWVRLRDAAGLSLLQCIQVMVALV